MAKQASTRSVLLPLLIALSACGGGGGNPDPASNTAPVADAGKNRSVNDGARVTLDGGASSDADGDTLMFGWKQTGGAPVSLDDTGKREISFDVPTTFNPAAGKGRTLTFELTVSDGEASAKDSVTITVKDTTPPGIAVTPAGNVLGKSESILVTFSEFVDQDSLVLTGALADEAKRTWHEDKPVLELSPKAEDGEWTSGADRSLSIAVSDPAGHKATLDANFLVKLVFENFQPADVVIGQPDMTTNNEGGGDAGLHVPYGRAWVHGERLYLPDYGNNRVLGFNNIPGADGATADFVIGQPDFALSGSGTSQTAINGPQAIVIHDQRLIVTEYGNSRIAIYSPLPTLEQNSAPGTLSTVIGQADFVTNDSSCAPNRLDGPEDSTVTPDGRLVVADTFNNRVLIWNTLPVADGIAAQVTPDLVLGQAAFDQCAENDSNRSGDQDPADAPAANTMDSPAGVWSDGEKLVVLDGDNHRALIWDTFPTSNGQPADRVLGQPDFESNAVDNTGDEPHGPAANTLNDPYIGVFSNGEQLFIADNDNHRVLIWNSWPTENHQPADGVLGQANFELAAPNNDDANDGTVGDAPTARTLNHPRGLLLYQDKLIVTDGVNNRYLIYSSR